MRRGETIRLDQSNSDRKASEKKTCEYLMNQCGFGNFDEALSALLELKQLNELHFDANFQNSQAAADGVIIRLVERLVLKWIGIFNDKVSAFELSNILEYSDNLTNINTKMGEIHIDLAAYHSILVLIKSHHSVELKIKEGHIDGSIFNQNEQRLQQIGNNTIINRFTIRFYSNRNDLMQKWAIFDPPKR